MKKTFKPRVPFAKLPEGELKLYLARFDNAATGDLDFYKFGHTSFHDAADRFKYDPDQYKKWKVTIIKTVWGPSEDILNLELEYQQKYPKNFWIEEKIGGVTEITRISPVQVKNIINEFELLGTKFYQARERKRILAQREYDLNG